MRLVQLNIWQGRLLQQVISHLKELNPDIVCLQEVYSSELDTSMMPFYRSIERISAEMPDYHVYFSPTLGMQVLGQEVFYGIAFLSRLPIKSKETFDINETYAFVNSAATMKVNTRNLQRVELEMPDGRSLWVANHHGYWEMNPIGSQQTIDCMQKVADILSDTPRPLIFAGDLNIIASSPAMKPIHNLLTDLTDIHGLTNTLTSLGKVADVPCDHVCISKEIMVNNYELSPRLVSDHAAVILDFDIQ